MATHRVMYFFIVGENTFVIKQTPLDDELFSTKRYLFKMSTSNIEIRFEFNVEFLSKGLVEIFKNPVVSANGTLLSPQPVALTVYSEPTVTNQGTFFYNADPANLDLITHVLTFDANTDYLLKITPKDINNVVLA